MFVLSRVDLTTVPHSSSVSEEIVHALKLALFHDSSLRIDGSPESARFARLVNLTVVSASAVEIDIVLDLILI